ncbi:MAG: encapsulin-associated ferritin-like protein [Iamia sp.]
MTSEGFHESVDKLSVRTQDHHRAIVSLMEELEAVDWYDQRVEATDDEELAAILAHNRDEEKEHAAMTLEWLRRRDPGFDEQLRTYLFAEGSILGAEEAAMGDGDDGPDAPSPSAVALSDGSLGIGSLRRNDFSL